MDSSVIKRVLSLSLLTCLLSLLVYHYRDSIVPSRTSPTPRGTLKSGVVFFDRLRAQQGYYNVINPYIEFGSCDVLDMDGQSVYSFAGQFCHFFTSGSVLLLAADSLVLYDASGKKSWLATGHFHHDMDVNEDESEIFAIAHEPVNVGSSNLWTDVIHGYDLSGREVFNWNFNSHKDEIAQIIGDQPHIKIDPSRGENRSFISHLNSVQVIPPNDLEAKLPAFRRGNILSNCFDNQVTFVIDRISGKNRLESCV